MRFFAGMDAHMGGQIALVYKTRIAYSADMRFLPGMNLHMGYHVPPAGIALFANTTDIESHTRMGITDMRALIV